MKFALLPVQKVKEKLDTCLVTLEEPFTTTKKYALLGVLATFLGGMVIGFLAAPARTKTVSFGSNNTYMASNEEKNKEDAGEEAAEGTEKSAEEA